MEARVAGVPEDEESGLLPRRPSAAAAGGRRPPSRGPRFPPPPPAWVTVDGPLGLPLEEAEGHARRFFLWGFACLPFLWAINCCYFWPVLRSPAASSPAAFGPIRPCKDCDPHPPSSSSILISSHLFVSRVKDLICRDNASA
jgi:presenilin enhancer 2